MKITQPVNGKCGMPVQPESDFAQTLTRLVIMARPLSIIETGTFQGTGTTAAVCRGLAALPRLNCQFYSIEANISNYGQALKNLADAGLLPLVRPLNGLSVPRAVLPSRETIQKVLVDNENTADIYVDFTPEIRADCYFRESDWPEAPDDLLGLCLKSCANRPDIVVLDSAGHLGFIEFQYVLSQLEGPCFFALDDTRHVKHHDSLAFMRQDARFNILKESNEKFGFCIAEYVPEGNQG